LGWVGVLRPHARLERAARQAQADEGGGFGG